MNYKSNLMYCYEKRRFKINKINNTQKQQPKHIKIFKKPDDIKNIHVIIIAVELVMQ